MGITEPRNDIEYVQTGQKGIAVAVDTITASSDVPKRMKPYDAARSKTALWTRLCDSTILV